MESSTKATVWANPPQADQASFTYYDIESLSNAFTLATYNAQQNKGCIFYLLDDATLETFDPDTARRAIFSKNQVLRSINPASPPELELLNLRQVENLNRLALLFGVTDADDVHRAALRPPHFTLESLSRATSDVDQQAMNRNRITYYRQFGHFPPDYLPVTDTMAHYDPYQEHPYLASYNGKSYDTTILAAFFALAISNPETDSYPFYSVNPGNLSAAKIRSINDSMFTEHRQFMPGVLANHRLLTITARNYKSTAWRIRKNLLDSGRHLDLTNFNEKQRMVGFKRLSGMLGRQILESEKLSGHDIALHSHQDVYELFAYNFSDVVGLHFIKSSSVYSNNFNAKMTLLNENPEVVYDGDVNGQPIMKPGHVRNKRLTVDSTSAQLTSTVLAPYESLQDDPTVSYVYPHPTMAKEYGVEPVDVLEECKRFFDESIGQYNQEAAASFQAVYDYYRKLSTLNVNSENTHPEAPFFSEISSVAVPNMNLPYYKLIKDPVTGQTRAVATDTFVTFSIGGLHGAQYNQALLESDELNHQLILMERELIRACLTDDTTISDDELALLFKQHGDILLPTGEVLKPARYLASSSTKTKASFKKLKEPALFKQMKSGTFKLDDRYVFTSMGHVIHMDYSSYYPNLLRNLLAFFNPRKGRDDYAQLYFLKEHYGKLIKSATDPLEKLMYSLLREAVKLALNSVTGAADSNHDTPIRMNNRILSMRILGQLFCWRVGQALALEGATVVSTNTDGLYCTGASLQLSQEILDKEMEFNHVLIEPEEAILISKDSNNRMEIHGDFMMGSGGSLGALNGPDIRNSLAHPAACDYGLSRYLAALARQEVTSPENGQPLTLFNAADASTIRTILEDLRDDESRSLAERLIFFQNIIAASPSSQTYTATLPYGTLTSEDDLKTLPTSTSLTGRTQYSRVFMVTEDTPNAVHVFSYGLWKIPAVSLAKRQRDGEMLEQHQPHAKELLYTQNYAPAGDIGSYQSYPSGTEAQLRKINGMSVLQPAVIINHDLHIMEVTLKRKLLAHLDIEAYVQAVITTYENSWRNQAVDEKLMDKQRLNLAIYQAITEKAETRALLYQFTQAAAPNNALTPAKKKKANAALLDDTRNQEDYGHLIRALEMVSANA